VDFFSTNLSLEDQADLINIEKSQTDASFVFVSDLWLDKPLVFEKLDQLFRGFSTAVIPLAFVFIGNFQSIPFTFNAEYSRAYKGCTF
jgi:DNA polymerase epsilon subunit 2